MRSTLVSSMATAGMKRCWVNGSVIGASPMTWSSSSRARIRPIAFHGRSRRSSTFPWIGSASTGRRSTSCIGTIPTCRSANSSMRSTGCIGPDGSASSGGRTGRSSASGKPMTMPRQNQLEPLRILNNNLSLAVMERPVWQGCISSNGPQTLGFLRDNNIVHLSWSSQARGYFLPEDLRNRLPGRHRARDMLRQCAERGTPAPSRGARRRAGRFGAQYRHGLGLGAAISVLCPHGPRSAGEIVTTLPALELELSANEVAWLNLEKNDR